MPISQLLGIYQKMPKDGYMQKFSKANRMIRLAKARGRFEIYLIILCLEDVCVIFIQVVGYHRPDEYGNHRWHRHLDLFADRATSARSQNKHSRTYE